MRIARVETIPIHLPRRRDAAQGTAGSPTALVESAGDYRWSDTVGALYSVQFETALVKVTTDEGGVGWGEAQAPLAPEIACDIVRLLLAPILEGAEFDGAPQSIAKLYDRMYQSMRVRGQTGGFMLDAISGVDLALWDLAGKASGCSVAALISETAAARVPAYWSGLADGSAAEPIARGFRLVKVFHDAGTDTLLGRVDALRAAAGSNLRIAVDALWRLDSESAVALGLDLDRRDVLWLEAPLPPEDAEGHRRLAAQIRTPLAVGESYRTVHELAPFLSGGAIRFVQPDLGRCGITGFLRIADAARRAGAEVVPHVSIALAPQIAAAIHASAAAGCRCLEYNPHVFGVANRYTRDPLALDGPAYAVPLGPGLGADIDEEKLRADLLPPRN